MLTFPTLPGLAWPVKRTTIWSSLRQRAVSGRETRLQLWSYPQYRYEIPISVLRAGEIGEYEALAGFINSVGGSSQAWRFHDQNDGAVVDQLFGVGDGATFRFQLTRTAFGFSEPVFAPSSVAIKSSGLARIDGVDYTISETGLVTFAAAPPLGAQLTWTGSFDWLCRFDDDEIELTNFLHQLWSGSLKFSTVKL